MKGDVPRRHADLRPHDGEGAGANFFRRLRELFDQPSDLDPEEHGERLAALAVLESYLALRGLQEELDLDSLIRELNLTGVRAI